jgi:hypothetical protein
MARAQNPESGDSQFFICFDDARFLDNQYTVWGRVTEGMENVDKIKRGEPVQNPDKIVSRRTGAHSGSGAGFRRAMRVPDAHRRFDRATVDVGFAEGAAWRHAVSSAFFSRFAVRRSGASVA